MEKFRSRFNTVPSRRLPLAFLAAGMLLSSACGIDPYSHDRYNVPCDGTVTVADFPDDEQNVTFFADDNNDNTVMLTIKKLDRGVFDYNAEILGSATGTELEAIGPVATDGQADVDYLVAHGDAQWSVNVLPEDNRVLVSGSC